MASSSTFNRNPEGKNQYGTVCESNSRFVLVLIQVLYMIYRILVTADSQLLQDALNKYHRRLITDNRRISELLLAEYDIDMK
jgi:hypothetical protein